MAEAKKIPKEGYLVQLTLTRTEARLVHKLLGVTTGHVGDKAYDALTQVLGEYNFHYGLEVDVQWSPRGIKVTEEIINEGYQED